MPRAVTDLSLVFVSTVVMDQTACHSPPDALSHRSPASPWNNGKEPSHGRDHQ